MPPEPAPSSRRGDPARPAAEPPALRSRAALLALAVVLVATVALRWRLLDVPLERDEGEYAYAGQLLLAGHAPFDGAYNMKLPGAYAAYAAVMAVFGQTDVGIHLGLLVASLVSAVLVFALGARLSGPWAGALAAALFAPLALSARVQGMFANAEHFVLPLALGGVLALLPRAGAAPRLRRALLGGVLLGAAFLVKQHAVCFVALGALLVATEPSAPPRRRALDLATFGLGAALPYALTVAWCLAAGTFGDFWTWTWTFAREYVGLVGWERGAKNLATNGGALARSAWLACALAACGAAALLVRGAGPRRARLVAGAFALASAAATTPGLYFRPHYFVLLLPAAVLLAALGALALARLAPPRARPLVAAALALAATAEIVLRQRGFLFRLPPDAVARALYGPSPFPESRELGRWIRENTAEDARIAALCSEPQLYFYARRRSSTGFLYLYAPMEESELARRLQERLIAELEAHPPEIVITTPSRDSFADYPGTWRDLRRAHPQFFEWYERTLARYELVGVADVRFPAPTAYLWGADARALVQTSPYALLVHRLR